MRAAICALGHEYADVDPSHLIYHPKDNPEGVINLWIDPFGDDDCEYRMVQCLIFLQILLPEFLDVREIEGLLKVEIARRRLARVEAAARKERVAKETEPEERRAAPKRVQPRVRNRDSIFCEICGDDKRSFDLKGLKRHMISK